MQGELNHGRALPAVRCGGKYYFKCPCATLRSLSKMAAPKWDWIAVVLSETMFGKKAKRELDPPPLATRNAEAVEVLRVWASSGHAQEVVLKTTWKDAGAWGLMLRISRDMPRTRTRARAITAPKCWRESVSCLMKNLLTQLLSPLKSNKRDTTLMTL